MPRLMRVLIVNTSEKTGGAAIAASRLKDALINNGVKAKMLVNQKETDNLSVVDTSDTAIRRHYHFMFERFLIWKTNGFSRQHLFDIDTASHGTDITRLPEFKEADVIHLHWINQGFLSFRSLRKILQSGKPVVWTLHDMWPFTGICHYAHDCVNFATHCHDCPLLVKPSKRDLSYRIFEKKQRLYEKHRLTFVACSHWLADEARKSHLLSNMPISAIPNPINTVLFRPRDKEKARLECRLPLDKRLILFSAFRTTLPIKGLRYFSEACHLFNKAHPEWKDQTAIVAVGKDADNIADQFPYPVYSMGYINDEKRMASIYSACDAFVIPSLQDNLPNTIVEAMTSGVPVIGFRVGGIPQMIQHLQNGYLAEPQNAADLENGLNWIFASAQRQAEASAKARSFAVNEYSEHNVAMRYIEIYNQLCDKSYE